MNSIINEEIIKDAEVLRVDDTDRFCIYSTNLRGKSLFWVNDDLGFTGDDSIMYQGSEEECKSILSIMQKDLDEYRQYFNIIIDGEVWYKCILKSELPFFIQNYVNRITDNCTIIPDVTDQGGFETYTTTIMF